jgi:hypothetical protein
MCIGIERNTLEKINTGILLHKIDSYIDCIIKKDKDMKLKEFKDKEELINEVLHREDINKDFSFYEIDFDNKEVCFVEKVEDFEYGWLDFEDRTFTFKELEEYNEGKLLKKLIKKIKGII